MIRKKNGFTLVELLVALALTGIVMAAVYRSFSSQQKVFSAQDEIASVQQDLRAGMVIMVKDIRMAGYSPVTAGMAGITIANASSLQFTTDLDQDGILLDAANDPGEQLTYSLSAGPPVSLVRASWGGASQPVADNIDVLNFVYLDVNGVVIPTPVPAANLGDIRSIQITVVGSADRADRDYRNATQYRNQQGTVVYAAPGDGFRRRVLSATVRCRNLGAW